MRAGIKKTKTKIPRYISEPAVVLEGVFHVHASHEHCDFPHVCFPLINNMVHQPIKVLVVAEQAMNTMIKGESLRSHL